MNPQLLPDDSDRQPSRSSAELAHLALTAAPPPVEPNEDGTCPDGYELVDGECFPTPPVDVGPDVAPKLVADESNRRATGHSAAAAHLALTGRRPPLETVVEGGAMEAVFDRFAQVTALEAAAGALVRACSKWVDLARELDRSKGVLRTVRNEAGDIEKIAREEVLDAEEALARAEGFRAQFSAMAAALVAGRTRRGGP